MRYRKFLMRILLMALAVALIIIISERADMEKAGAGQPDSARYKDTVTPTPTAEGTPEPTAEPLPELDLKSWELILINDLDYENYLSDSYVPQVEMSVDGQYFHINAIDALEKMVEDCQAAGNPCLVALGYRSYNQQAYLFNGKCSQLSWDGTYTYDEAVELARKITAYPGTSDHQTGLAVDIIDEDRSTWDREEFESFPTLIWLREHCSEYGFILRYPKDKEEETGRTYEPWHFRYVGVEAAAYIMEHGLCLEEFLALYE